MDQQTDLYLAEWWVMKRAGVKDIVRVDRKVVWWDSHSVAKTAKQWAGQSAVKMVAELAALLVVSKVAWKVDLMAVNLAAESAVLMGKLKESVKVDTKVPSKDCESVGVKVDTLAAYWAFRLADGSDIATVASKEIKWVA